MSFEERHVKAEVAINKALELDDQLGEAYTSLGLLNNRRNDLENAETAFKKGLKLNPNYATAYQWYGGFLDYLGREKEAKALKQKTLILDPLSPILNFNLGENYSGHGKFDEAMTQFEKLININPKHHLGYLGKADLFRYRYGRFDEAIIWYRKALSLNPDSEEYISIQGENYLALGSDTDAACWFNRLQKLTDQSFWTNTGLTHFHTYLGEDSQAIAYALKSIEVFPKFDETLFNLLRDQDMRRNRLNEARARYEKVYPALLAEEIPRINHGNFKIAIDLAYILLRTGEQKRANLLLDSALSFIGNKPRLGRNGYWIADAKIYAIQGKKQQALSALRQAVNAGWRVLWWYFLEHDLTFALLHGEPEFQAMLVEIKSDMSDQLARVKAMEKEGDVCVNP